MNLETQAEFARRLGKDKSHVTRLKQAGRLVMHRGKVVVDDSLALIEATESPLPRHIAKREALAEARAAHDDAPLPGETESLESIGKKIKRAQARKLAAEADQAEMARARIEGSLVEIDRVKAAGADLGGLLRDKLEALPARYAAELAAAVDTNAAHAVLTEAVELILEDIARAAHALPEKLRSDA